MTSNRRQFLHNMAGAVAVAGILPLLPGCGGVTRADLKNELAPGTQDNSLTPELAGILRQASLAPSGHNSQPWFVRVIGQQELMVGLDEERLLPAVDPDNREALLALGAFVENLVLAAGATGYETEVRVVASDNRAEDVVHLRLHPGNPTGYPLVRLGGRRTIKKGQLPGELSSRDVQALAEPFDGRFFYFPKSSSHSTCIRDGAVEAFKAQAWRNEAQQELARWVRLGNAEARKKRDGLTSDSMEIQGVTGWFMRTFMDRESVMSDGFRTRGVDLTAELAGQGGGWIIITSPGAGPADLVETGRRFERMALLATDLKVAIHPMTQQIEEEQWRKEIAGRHAPDMLPQFILRVGYVEQYPAPVSLRRPVSWFLRS